MTAAAILAIDRRPEFRARLADALRDRYGRDYDVVAVPDPIDIPWPAACALVLVAPAPGVDALEVLRQARRHAPHARRALVVPFGCWADSDVSALIREAVATGLCDYYVLSPTGEADEPFHEAVSGLLYEWARTHGSGRHPVRVLCLEDGTFAHRVRDLLTRNGVPFTVVQPGSTGAADILARAAGHPAAECLVEFHDGTVLSAPDDVALGRAFGFLVEPPDRVFDVAIVGGGPAGLATAVYTAADGLDVIVIEAESMGGQSSSSSLIRNYLGFARGIGGAELALRAYQQAWVFGATMLMMRRVTDLRKGEAHFVVHTTGGHEVRCRSVVLAMGVTYRRLGVPELDALVGAGVFYGGASGEGARVRGGDAYVVGAGNSAGQAALHLARDAQRVHLVVRGPSLDTMSAYLVTQLHHHPAINIRLGSEVVGGGSDGHLTHLELRDRATGEREVVPATGLFVLIGATPHTEWLAPEFELDDRGFLCTGSDVAGRRARPFETSVPAVFAAGDVRHGSLKRVGAAVGDGAAVAREAFDAVQNPGGGVVGGMSAPAAGARSMRSPHRG